MFCGTEMKRQHRRHFLRLGCASLLGLGMPRLLAAESGAKQGSTGTAKNVILLWLGGGPATIDMWDPKPDAPDTVRGEFATIQTAVPDVRFCEHLPKLAAVMDHCTLLRSLGHNIPDHGPGSQYVLTGHLPSPATEYPSLGSVAASRLRSNASIPAYIAFGNPAAAGAGYLGSAWNPLALEDHLERLPRGLSLGEDADLTSFSQRIQLRNQFDERFERLNQDLIVSGLDKFQQQAVDILREDSIGRALDLENASEQTRTAYGLRSALGRNALRACRLVVAGARFITIGMTGWDTHANNFAELRNNLLPQLDLALSALITDLEARQLLSSTIVCCCGEFGRTPHVNGSAGRDHWSRAMSVLLAGGGFKAGYVHGATDEHGGEPIEGACAPADLLATILRQLGIDPDSSLTTPAGRDVPIMRHGKVVDDLVG